MISSLYKCPSLWWLNYVFSFLVMKVTNHHNINTTPITILIMILYLLSTFCVVSVQQDYHVVQPFQCVVNAGRGTILVSYHTFLFGSIQEKLYLKITKNLTFHHFIISYLYKLLTCHLLYFKWCSFEFWASSLNPF